MRRHRLALVILPVAAVAFSGLTAHAAPPGPNTKPQVVDPKGDSSNGAAYDILSGIFTTSGTTSHLHGKTVYTPDALVVSLTMAAAPSGSSPSKYAFDAQIAGCGAIDLQYTPGAAEGSSYEYFGCPTGGATSGTGLLLAAKVEGDTITWTIPFSKLPKQVKLGSKFSGFDAYTAYAEPVTGVVDTGAVMPFDEAKGSGTWRLS